MTRRLARPKLDAPPAAAPLGATPGPTANPDTGTVTHAAATGIGTMLPGPVAAPAPSRRRSIRPSAPAAPQADSTTPVPLIAPARPPVAERHALVVLGETHFRRCMFRRVTVATPAAKRGRKAASYSVECIYPTLPQPLALGDIPDARRVCEACRYPGIFRADED